MKSSLAREAIELLGGRGCLLLLLMACGRSSDSPVDVRPAPVVPALESIDFTSLGSGKIAFRRYGLASNRYNTVYVVDAGAKTSTHILDNSDISVPAISPDGRSLAFNKYIGSTNIDVYLAKIDGNSTEQITRFSGYEGPPSWSADGTKIVVASSVSDAIQNVYTQSAVPNATDQLQLTHFTPGQGGLLECPFINNHEVRVSMSSQGMMAFACRGEEIDILHPNGTLASVYRPSRTDVAHLPSLFAPEWSPDGTKVAFVEETSNGATWQVLGYAVKVMTADAMNITAVVPIPVTMGFLLSGSTSANSPSLCWMPDGSRLVFTVPEFIGFTENDSSIGHVWVVRADGTGLTRLTSAANTYALSVSCSAIETADSGGVK